MNKIPTKYLGPLLILLGLLPLLVYATQIRQLLFPRATYTGIPSRVLINPGRIQLDVVSNIPLYLSALAVDTNDNYITTGVTYIWGISSTNSVGNLIVKDNTAIATFIAKNTGLGDIWVKAITPLGEATSSIPVCIGVPCPTALPLPTPTASPFPTAVPVPTPTPFVEVLAPNGGESLTVDQSFTIRWRSSGVNNFLIYLVNSLGQYTLLNGVSSPSASYEWIANSPIMADTKLHKIMVVDSTPAAGETAVQDLSDDYFTILSCTRVQPTLTLTPNSQSGTPGEILTYNIALTNNDSVQCPPTHFEISSLVTSNWVGKLSSSSIDLAPSHTYQPQLSVTSSPTDYRPGSKPVSVYATSSNPFVSLQAHSAYLLLTAGDLNKNGGVDIFDYNTLIVEFGKTVASVADITGDGKVDIFDYNILVANFGK